MSTKKVIAIVLFCFQGLALLGAVLNGSLVGETNIFIWIGFLLFGIVGGILLYLDSKKKPQQTITNVSNKVTENSSILNIVQAKNVILDVLHKYGIYFCTDALMQELLTSSTFTRVGKIEKNLLSFFIESKLDKLLEEQQIIQKAIFDISVKLNKKLNDVELSQIFTAFCKVAICPEVASILSTEESREKYITKLISSNYL